MKKKMMVAGAASFAVAVMPMAGVFAVNYDSAVVDQVQVTVNTVCNMTSSATPQSASDPNGVYSKTVTPGTLVGQGGQSWDYFNNSVLHVSCNDSGGWKVTAQGVAGVGSSVAQNVLAASSDGTDIATGTATSGDTSNWAFRVSGDNIVSGYNNFSSVPASSTAVASSNSGVNDSVLIPAYRVWVSPTQEADTYTGYVKYILSAPL